MKSWNEIRKAAMAFLPQYVEATPIKQYRMSPGSYLTYKAWLVVVIRDGVVVQGINAKGECEVVGDKTQENAPESQEMPQDGLSGRQADNLPQTENKPAKSPKNKLKGASVADNPPTLEEIQGYMDERARQGKPFVYVTAEGFLDACEQSGWRLKDGKPMIDWRARLRTFENYRKEHGDRPVAPQQGGGQAVTPRPGDPVPATKPARGKYRNKW